MTRKEFIDSIKSFGIDENIVSFDSPFKEDSFCVTYFDDKWSVFWVERGGAHGTRKFNSEAEALVYLHSKLIN